MNVSVKPATVFPDGRKGNYMHTFSGGKYYPLDPRAEEVKIEDIAHALSMKCRYGGHCKEFYSVAEHSVYCSMFGPGDDALERLLHDASEAYNGDLIRPLKRDPEFAAPFRKVEEMNEIVIAKAFKLVFPYPPSVKYADELVTSAEVDQIINVDKQLDWTTGLQHDNSKSAPIKIKCMLPAEAKVFFMGRFAQLWLERA